MKMLNIKKSLKSKGFTLIELLIAVGFIAVASAGVYYIYNKVKSSQDANSEARNLDALRAGIKNLYASTSSYGGTNAVSNTFANQARVTPDGMRDATITTIKNKFGGTVTILPTTLGGGNPNNAFSIAYANVPGEVCVKLITSAGAQFDQVSAGLTAPGTVVKTYGSNIVNPVTTATACNTDSGNGVNITFVSL